MDPLHRIRSALRSFPTFSTLPAALSPTHCRLVRPGPAGRCSFSSASDDSATSRNPGGHDEPDNSLRPPVSIVDNWHLLEQIPLEDVRAFCLVAHVDHGKSSLSSRILELAGNLGLAAAEESEPRPNSKDATADSTAATSSSSSFGKERIELMDTLSVERQRGITVKASTASILYPHPSATGPTGLLLVHLHDTPGHVDFGSEVSRSLSFVQGAVLLLDATKGVQAQTYSVLDKARSRNLPLVVALTKVDLDAARPDHVALSVVDFLGRTGSSNSQAALDGGENKSDAFIDPDDIIMTSARNRIGIRTLLDAVCERIPPPTRLPDDDGEGSHGDKTSVLRAQVVDSWYDSRGVNCLVQILSGTLKEGDRISIKTSDAASASPSPPTPTMSSVPTYSVQEAGIVVPHPVRTKRLQIGCVNVRV
jgi:GTP-binding protein LepA